MTTKEKIRKGVAKIATESQDVKNEIITFVGDEFKKSISIKNQTQDTIKETTKETLDGIYEGISDVKSKGKKYTDRLTEKGVEIGEIMKKSAEAMVNAAKREGEIALTLNMKAAEKVQEFFETELNKVNHSLDSITYKAKAQMKVTLNNLNETKKEVINRLEAISNAFKHYPKENKNDASDAIHSTADKSEDAATDLRNLANSHSKKLTHHPLSKVSDWLKKLSNKVNS